MVDNDFACSDTFEKGGTSIVDIELHWKHHLCNSFRQYENLCLILVCGEESLPGFFKECFFPAKK